MQKVSEDRWIIGFLAAVVAWALFGLPFIYLNWHWLLNDAAGFFTFLLVVVGGLQLGFFAWQLRLIRESLDDTKIAAEAAKQSADAAKIQAETARDTLKVMQDTAERQLRAYVYLDVLGRPYPPPPKVPDRYSVALVIKNSGSTWARNVRVRHVKSVDPTASDAFDIKWEDIESHPILIGPNQEINMQFGDLTSAELRDIVDAKRRVFFLAWITYEDVLTDPPVTRQTQLFRQFNADDEGGASFAWMSTHNCADDDCSK
jgi:hypothetical protein